MDREQRLSECSVGVKRERERERERERIIFSVNTGSIKYCGAGPGEQGRRSTEEPHSKRQHFPLIIKYYSVKKITQPLVSDPE